jgi:hypothetical protein
MFDQFVEDFARCQSVPIPLVDCICRILFDHVFRELVNELVNGSWHSDARQLDRWAREA